MTGGAGTGAATGVSVMELFASADRARVRAAGHLLDILTAGASSPTAIEAAREGRRIFEEAVTAHRALGWDPVEPAAHLQRWRDRLALWWEAEARLAELLAQTVPAGHSPATIH